MRSAIESIQLLLQLLGKNLDFKSVELYLPVLNIAHECSISRGEYQIAKKLQIIAKEYAEMVSYNTEVVA